MYSPSVGFLVGFRSSIFARKKSLRFVCGLLLWICCILVELVFPRVSIEFPNLGGWLAWGDPALETQAHFLAVAEHRLPLISASWHLVGLGIGLPR